MYRHSNGTEFLPDVAVVVGVSQMATENLEHLARGPRVPGIDHLLHIIYHI